MSKHMQLSVVLTLSSLLAYWEDAYWEDAYWEDAYWERRANSIRLNLLF